MKGPWNKWHYLELPIWNQSSNLFNSFLATGNLLSADNLCKQLRPRMWVLIWIQTIWHSDNVPERIFEKVTFEKSQQTTTKAWKITQYAKSKYAIPTPGPKVIKLFSCSTQLSTKFILLINVKMTTIVGILTFISMINTTSERLKARTSLFVRILVFMSIWNLVLSWIEHEKSFITSGPDFLPFKM